MIKKYGIFIILILISGFSIKSDGLVPVSYSCCKNFTYSNGIQIDGFEDKDSSGIQLENFENVSNWTIGGIGASQEKDTIHFKEGAQSLKLVATNGNSAYTEKVISNNFLETNNFVYWIYLTDNDIKNFSFARIYLTSTGTAWSKYFYNSAYGGFRSGWNKLIFEKNGFINDSGESWNNSMNRIRIGIYPNTNQNINVTIDDLRYNMIDDWLAGGTSAYLENDIINFKEGNQGIKLIAINGSSGYMDMPINNNFSDTNNFVLWMYVNNRSTLSYVRIYFTSTGTTWSKYFSKSMWSSYVSGWNKFIINKKSFDNTGGESWNNIMNRIRLRIGPAPNNDSNVTFDDFRYNMTGQRAKLMIHIDDGQIPTITNASPILIANGQVATSFVSTDWVGDEPNPKEYMNLTQLKTLQSTGWEISSHTTTHPHLSWLNNSNLISALNDSYDWLVANNFQKTAGFIAYPFGDFNDNVIDETKKRYIFGRSTLGDSTQQHFTSLDEEGRYIQRIISVKNTTTVEYLKDWVNETINSKLLVIFLFHNILDSNPGTWEYLKTDFKEFSDYVKSRDSDIDVVTYSDYVIPNIKNFAPVINKTTRIYSNGTSVLLTINKYDEYMPNMTLKPLNNFIDINITMYNESGGLIKFNESYIQDINSQVLYDIGDRIPNQLYSVKIYRSNGTKYKDFNIVANSSGYINYNLEGFGDSRYQEIIPEGILDTSFTVTLPVGYTYLRFNAPNSTIKNLNPDGQNNSRPIFNIANYGNIAQSFRFYLNGTIANITTYADLDNDHATGRIEINTTSSPVISNLIPGNSQNIWLIVDAVKAPVTNQNRMLAINSS